ncbi:MAG: YihY/virulence factor BrkB family protein [Nitrospirota bacterium]|nr:MAG: YihY/virulence factor BrkB family protein [Nitrospirota bacterium]
MRCSKLFYQSGRAFIKNQLSIQAASLSYFTIMSIVPFTLLLITLVGLFLGGNPAVIDFIKNEIFEAFPEVTHDITSDIAKLITYKSIGIVSFLIYAYLSLRLMRSIEVSLNMTLGLKGKRKIHHSILISFGIITAIIFLFFVSFSITTIASLEEFLKRFIPAYETGVIFNMLMFFIQFILAWLIITLFYLFLPRKRPLFKFSFRSAFFVSIMLMFAKHLFTLFIRYVFMLGHIYGPLAAFIIFFLWIYYSSCIFLFGAQMINELTRDKEAIYEPSYW